MKFSYNWLKELVPFKESPEKLANFLTSRVFEVESIEKIGSDFALDIKLHSNRVSDCSGHLGMAKEIAGLKKLRTKLQSQTPKIKEDKKYKTGDYLSIRVENPASCPRYSARIMAQITIKPSPKWLRDRLETCGIQSVSNVVDAANFVMLLTGQPMHIFDFEKLFSPSKAKKTIIVRDAKKDETITTLDEKTYMLQEGMLVIADGERPIAIAGIKGGKDTGVTTGTSTIILESANFHPAVIRSASQRLSLRTDAGIRFEHGLDPHQTTSSLDFLAELILEIAGGIVLHDTIDIYPHREKPEEILFRTEYANRMIGAEIEAAFYHDIFRALGATVRAKRKDEFIIEPPTIRRDLRIEEDLIEEASRIIGLDAIPAILPEVVTLSPQQEEELFWEKKIMQYAVSAGFFETLVYEFTGTRELECFMLDAPNALELENPTSPDTRFLLPRALIKYVSLAAENLHHFDSVRIHGIAKSFLAPKTKNQEHSEKKELVVCYAKKETGDGDNFYVLKGVLDGLFESLGIADHWYDDAITQETRKNLMMFHPHRVAEIKVGNARLGVLGEIHPEVLSSLKTKTRIVVSEIDFETLWRICRSEHEFLAPSKFPAIIRDIALTVPTHTKVEEVLNIIEPIGATLLEDTELFDYFQDEALIENQEKSLAFHLVFQSRDRTLKDEEVEKIMQKMIIALEEKGWEVRK